MAEKRLELVPYHRDRAVFISLPLILLPVETDLVPGKGRGKRDLGRPRSSGGSKIVIISLTKVVAVHVGLPVVYVQGTGLQLLSGCLGNDGSWSGSESKNGSRSGSRNLDLQNSLKNLLQVILGIFGDTNSSRVISNGGFRP